LEFSDKLTLLRKHKTVEVPAQMKHVSEGTGISSRRLKLFEEKKSVPDLNELKAIAKYYDVTVSSLTEEVEIHAGVYGEEQPVTAEEGNPLVAQEESTE
jgi:transcriptional regulator with XRE-family HTH domain